MLPKNLFLNLGTLLMFRDDAEVSGVAQDFVKKLLVVKPTSRQGSWGWWWIQPLEDVDIQVLLKLYGV